MKIAFLGNTDFSIYNYRFELVQRLLNEKHEVLIVTPKGDLVKKMVDAGCKYIDIKVDQHGLNPFHDLKLKNNIYRILKKERPDYVCGYTIKPNIYGAWACKKLNIKFIANITGLGTAAENPGLVQKIIVKLYKIAFRNVKRVFCQNEENRVFFINYNIVNEDKLSLLPGSGVNLERFKLIPYPNSETTRFVFVSRIRKDKGIDEYITAARHINEKYKNTEFHVCGVCDDEYKWISNEKSVIYHGMVSHIEDVLKDMNCLIFPSYYAEGMANVLLEASAIGRPIMTTNRPGCKETIEDGYNGFIINEKDSNNLIEKIEYFLSLSTEEQCQLGLNGRAKVENEFNRQIIIDKYLRELELL